MEHTHKAHREDHQQFRGVDLTKIRMVNNRVLCKRLTHNIDEPIKGIYYPPKYNQNDKMVINADRMYEVVCFPRRLIKNKISMWETSMDIQEGDIVWTNILSALNSPEVVDADGSVYRMLRYHDLIVAKRGEKVIPLNGNILMSNFYTRTVVGLKPDLSPQYAPAINYSLAWVKYKGKKNKQYYRIKKTDDGNDPPKEAIVVLDLPNKNMASMDRNYIEDDARAAFSDERFFYHQRKDILAVIEKDDTK